MYRIEYVEEPLVERVLFAGFTVIPTCQYRNNHKCTDLENLPVRNG